MIGRLIGSKVFWLIFAGGLAIALYLAFAVFGVQAAFVDREVNESFSASTTNIEETTSETEESSETEPAGTTNTASTDADGENAGSEDADGATSEAAGPVKVLQGAFHDAEYEGTGDAAVYRLANGSHVLRLENLNVENGPDLFVYAVAADDAYDSATVEEAGFVSAGPLKGNQGNQTYELPADFDPEVHRSVTIWCQRFSGNFATAPLRTA